MIYNKRHPIILQLCLAIVLLFYTNKAYSQLLSNSQYDSQVKEIVLQGFDIDDELLRAVDSASRITQTHISLCEQENTLLIVYRFGHIRIYEVPNENVVKLVFQSLRSPYPWSRINGFSSFDGKTILLSGINDKARSFVSKNDNQLRIVSHTDYSCIDSTRFSFAPFTTGVSFGLLKQDNKYKINDVASSQFEAYLDTGEELVGDYSIPLLSIDRPEILSTLEVLSNNTTFPLDFGNPAWGFFVEIYSDEGLTHINIDRFHNTSYILSPLWSTPFVYCEYAGSPIFITGDISFISDIKEDAPTKTIHFSELDWSKKFYVCISYDFIQFKGQWFINYCSRVC